MTSPLTSPIEAELLRTEADYLAAWAVKDGKHHRTLRILVSVLAILGAVVLGLAWPVTPGIWTVALTLLVVAMIGLPSHSRRQARRAWQILPEGLHRVTLTVTETHFGTRNELHESVRPWSMLQSMAEDDVFFVLTDKTHQISVWRKDAFDTADVPRVRSLLERAAAPPAGALSEPGSVARDAERDRVARNHAVARKIRIGCLLAVAAGVAVTYTLWRSL